MKELRLWRAASRPAAGNLGRSAPLSTPATGILGALASLAILLLGLVKGEL